MVTAAFFRPGRSKEISASPRIYGFLLKWEGFFFIHFLSFSSEHHLHSNFLVLFKLIIFGDLHKPRLSRLFFILVDY